jgi:hypothetical protein
VVSQIGHPTPPPQQIEMEQLSEGKSAPHRSMTVLAPPSLPNMSAQDAPKNAERGAVHPSQAPTASAPQPHHDPRCLPPDAVMVGSGRTPTPTGSAPATSASFPAVQWVLEWGQEASPAVATAQPPPARDVTPAYVPRPPLVSQTTATRLEAPMWLTTESAEDLPPHLSDRFPQLRSVSIGMGWDAAAQPGLPRTGKGEVGCSPRDLKLKKSLSLTSSNPDIRLTQKQSLAVSTSRSASVPPTGRSNFPSIFALCKLSAGGGQPVRFVARQINSQ